jgi:hypothetical protein
MSRTSTAKMPTVKPLVPDTPSVREAAVVAADGMVAEAAVGAGTAVAVAAGAARAAAEIAAGIVVLAAVAEEIAAATTNSTKNRPQIRAAN